MPRTHNRGTNRALTATLTTDEGGRGILHEYELRPEGEIPALAGANNGVEDIGGQLAPHGFLSIAFHLLIQ